MEGRFNEREVRGKHDRSLWGDYKSIGGKKLKYIVELTNYLFSQPFFYSKTPKHCPRSTPSAGAPRMGQHKTEKPCRWTGNQLHYGGVLCCMVQPLSTICL